MIGGSRQHHGDLTQMRARSAELFARLREDGASEAERSHYRDQLVHLHLPLVEHFARRFLNRGEPFDDLLQVGTIGLIKAIDRFDTERGVEFSTYATPTIVGEIKRHFRDRGWAIRVPRRLQELRLSITTATADLTCTFDLDAARLSVAVSAVCDSPRPPNRDGFAWTVLAALTNEVSADVEGDTLTVTLARGTSGSE